MPGLRARGRDLYGPYVNRDHFAGLLELLIPIAALYVAGNRGRLSLPASLLAISAVVLAFAALLLTGSRGGLMALCAEAALAAFALGRARSGPRRRGGRRLVLASVVTLLAGLLLFAYMDPGWAAKRLGVVAHFDSWGEWIGFRKTLALDGLRMWRARPLVGVGLGNFETTYPRYQSHPSDYWVDHAHNDYVEAGAETGVIGALLILSAAILFLRLVFRDRGRSLRSRAQPGPVGRRHRLLRNAGAQPG